MSDEGFREIQLNGKQLVFLFMAATVVSVVIFLCGVLVGRGVRPPSPALEAASAEVAPDQTASQTTQPSMAPVGESQAGTPSAELTYAERLTNDKTTPETLKAAPAEPAPAPPVQEPPPPVEPPRPSTTPATPAPAAAPPASTAPPPRAVTVPASDPSGPGFAVQVAAYRDRQEADTLARQLAAKGYPAFVMEPVRGAPTPFFRVRVGKFKTLKDAETVSAKLQTAEQFTKAWIVR